MNAAAPTGACHRAASEHRPKPPMVEPRHGIAAAGPATAATLARSRAAAPPPAPIGGIADHRVSPTVPHPR
jgi:hypothetical protein